MPAGDRKNQLLETALEAFACRGYEGTTTKEVASAAGVTEAVIFRHFPTKQALYEAVLEYGHKVGDFEPWLAEIKACMDRKDDQGLFRTLARKILRSYREDGRCQRVLLFAALEGHQQGLAFNRQLSGPIVEMLIDYVQRRQQEGAMQRFAPAAIIAAIAGMAAHYAMMTQLFGFQANTSDDEIVDAFTRIMMDGIRTPAPTEE